MIRITADMDNIPPSVASTRTTAIIEYLYNRIGLSFDRKIIRKSSSGKGCHVILWTKERLTKEQIVFIRYILGDDVKRIKKDLKRRRCKQYLFKRKVKLT